MPNFYGPTPPMSPIPKFNGPKPATLVTKPRILATHKLTLPTEPTLSRTLLLSNINNSAPIVIIRGDFSANTLTLTDPSRINGIFH